MTRAATQPTPRGTGALLAVLAALGGYLAFVERPRLTAGPAAPEAPPLLSEPAARVARIELDEAGRHIAVVRGSGGWTDPGGRPWDDGAVGDLLQTLGSLRPLMIVDPDPPAPADYGLGGAAPRVELVAADGRRLLALEVGERNPAWTGLYVRLAGQRRVILVGAVLAWDLDKLRAAAPAGRGSRPEQRRKHRPRPELDNTAVNARNPNGAREAPASRGRTR